MNMEEILAAQKEAFKKGNVLIEDDGNIYSVPIKDLVNQSTDGLLYDLNRLESVIMTIFAKSMVVNELALVNIVRYLHNRAKEKGAAATTPEKEC